MAIDVVDTIADDNSPILAKSFNTAIHCSTGFVLSPIQQCYSDSISMKTQKRVDTRLGAQSLEYEYTEWLEVNNVATVVVAPRI